MDTGSATAGLVMCRPTSQVGTSVVAAKMRERTVVGGLQDYCTNSLLFLLVGLALRCITPITRAGIWRRAGRMLIWPSARGSAVVAAAGREAAARGGHRRWRTSRQGGARARTGRQPARRWQNTHVWTAQIHVRVEQARRVLSKLLALP
jgi:hypothetical protein